MSTAVADEKPRLRHNAGNGTDETHEKSNAPSPSNLERGGAGTGDDLLKTGKDPTDPPVTKSRRFLQFAHRIQGKHVDRIPTLKEGLKATARASREFKLQFSWKIYFGPSWACLAWQLFDAS
jgi:hypothetical protein